MTLPVIARRPWEGFGIVGAAYAVALLAASASTRALADLHPLWTVAAADVAATLVVFVFSRAFDNTSVYDPYWSLAPAFIGGWLAFVPGQPRAFDPRQLLVLTLCIVYAVRLTWNWARGWAGLAHEDWRYAELRPRTGRLYWVVSLLGLHLVPTALTYLGSLPLYDALVTGGGPLGALDLVAAAVTFGAIAVETVADEQLRHFRRDAKGEGEICQLGLWRYSRHPNYFGELAFWFGLFLFGVAAGGPLWHGAGVVALVALFVTVSVPLAERRSLKRRPQYAELQRRVSALIPWFPRKG